jgi:hypothetical protein
MNPLNETAKKCYALLEEEVKRMLENERKVAESYICAWALKNLGTTRGTTLRYLHAVITLNKDMFMDFDKRDRIIIRQKEIVKSDNIKE